MPVPVLPDDPFRDQLEWLNHRYDPGHFLGGTLRPELRLSLGREGKRMAGLLAFASGFGVLAILAALGALGHLPPEPRSLVAGLLSVLVGRRMWKSAASGAPGAAMEAGGEGRKLGRMASMALVATLATAAACLGLLLIVGTIARLIQRAGGLLGAMGVLLVAALLEARRSSAGEPGGETKPPD